MKFITSNEETAHDLACLAIQHNLFHSYAWIMHDCYESVIGDIDHEEKSKIILLQNDDAEYIGAVYFNDECSEMAWGTNVQMYIKPEYRGNGYARQLFISMTNLLKSSGWRGTLHSGYGIPGSDDFWDSMNNLYLNEPTKYYEVEFSY